VGFARCRGGGGGGGGAFDVVSFSATQQSPRVYLNDRIEILFNQPVDPRTVFSGVFIYPSLSAGAKRARGEFRVEGAKVVFIPAIPTDPGYLNGGLQPDTEYTICVPSVRSACSVYLPGSPGLRSASGRGLSATRTERFLTVRASGSSGVFRPEIAPRRPAVVGVTVNDSAGVEQKLNPIVNLVAGQTWRAGIYTLTPSTPSTTLIPGENRRVPRSHYRATTLDRKVEGRFDPGAHIITRDPLKVVWDNPTQPIEENEFKDTGGVLTIRDSSSPPIEASWAVASNTATEVETIPDSGPRLDAVGFKQEPFTIELTQGITRQVAPGDLKSATKVRIAFDEALNPATVTLDHFQMWKILEENGQLRFEAIPAASTLTGSPRQGITHEVIGGCSVVTLRPKTSFPKSRPGRPATVGVPMRTAQPLNWVDPAPKGFGIRDLNEFPLAYPVRTGWVLNVDANNRGSTVAYHDPLAYTNAKPFPENTEVMWCFQTRADLQVANAVVETFSDREMISEHCWTTAAWTRSGQAGLYATYGYGGSGELGDVVISGAVGFDSDAMRPGPDGLVELNYHRFVVAPTGVVTLQGKRPFRINAAESLVIEGTIDASGRNGALAPAGTAASVGRVAGGRGGPGGGAGGDSNTHPQHPVGALPWDLRGGPGWPQVITQCGEINRSANRLVGPYEPNCGGGMGGHRGLPLALLLRSGCSGNGGGHLRDGVPTDLLCSNDVGDGGHPGERWVVTIGPSAVQFPTAGTGGGAGGNAAPSSAGTSPANDIVGGSGGGGGGGVELVSAGTLEVKGGALILAVGGNGGNGHTTVAGGSTIWGGYGAGGAGGSIWLSGTSVTVASGAKLDARGGTGNPVTTNPNRTGNGGDGYVIIRDRGASPEILSNDVTPGPLPTREDFSPSSNGRSVAYSAWHDSGLANPGWSFDASDPRTGELQSGANLTWLNPPGSGQTARIAFQGAPDSGGAPDPDPAKWYPSGNTPSNPCAVWETDVSKLRAQGGLRHLRFRIEFDIGKRDKNASPPNQVAISQIVIPFQDPQ